MALSRLREPVVSRASSLFRARLLSSSRSFSSRSYNALYSFVRDLDTVPRPTSMHRHGRDHDKYLYNKPRIGVRYFSTSDSHQVLGMPALSPTMNQGNITMWRKKEGDKIEVGDVLCEIETDKATLEYESLEEGFLAKILVPGGSKDVPVGQPIAVMVEEEDDIKNVPDSVAGGSEGKGEISQQADVKTEEPVQETSSTTIDTSDLPPHMVLEMPALSPTMNQGNIAKWRKKEGDKIEVGDILCEIETDKATLEFESMEEGYLAKIIAVEGAKDILVGQPIAITVEELADLETVKNAVLSGSSAKEEKPVNRDVKHETGSQKGPVKRISPAAKILITEHGIDSSLLKASGPHGTLLKGDVLAAIKSGTGSLKASSSQQKSTPSPQSHQKTTSADSKSPAKKLDSFEDFPNSQIRKVIARRLLESKQNTPHLYLSSDVILDPLLSLRKDLKEQHNVKVSVNDIVIKAVAVALRNVPEANAYWDVEKGETVLCESVDISIAVATEKGLMTPIIRNADQKTLSAISAEVKELAEKARVGKLKPNEFQGGTFSISNLGMFPVDQFCAIINPPQAGILAVGRGNKVVEPVVGSDGVERAAAITKMNLTLSADHRVFDGKVGGAFLSALNSNFSDIRRLLL